MELIRTLSKIAFRNVFRNKRRTVLTVMILVLGSSGLLLVGGFFEGIHDSFREQYIHGNAGHLQVNVKNYFAKGASAPFKYLMRNAAPVTQLIRLEPHVLLTVPQIKSTGMASTEKTNVAVIALGVDAASEKLMQTHKYSDINHNQGSLVSGEDLDPNDPQGIVMGQGLIKALGLKVGDKFSYITTREAGTIDGAEYHIRGTFRTILKEFDDRGIKMNLAAAQKVLGLSDEVHSILVVLDDTENTDAVQSSLQGKFEAQKMNVETITWLEQGYFYRQGHGFLDKMYTTVQWIIAIVFFCSIANTINMAVFERIREFGTMMATGNTRPVIFSVIFFEAVVMGILGGLLGLAFGAVVAKIISMIGIVMPPLPGSSSNYIALVLLNPVLVLKVFSLAVLSTVMASLIPAYRASHFEIVHALGYV